jgi:D-alanyl-D-alanine carboxypeptidase
MSATKLNIFEILKWTTMNPLEDQTERGSADPRRGTSIRFLNKTLNHMYSKNCLVNTDEFYGIVVMQFRRDSESVNLPHTIMNSITGVKNAPGNHNVYKVYIPELECRPYPMAVNDPILATYQDVMGADLAYAMGDIVRIQYGDLGNMKNPRIVGKMGTVPGDFLPARMAEGLANQFDNGSPTLLTAVNKPLVKIHAPSGKQVENGLLHEHDGFLKKSDKSGTVLLADVIHNFNLLYNRFSLIFPQKKLIASGYRTYNRQVSLKAEKPKLAARPGSSNHGWGLAFDWNTGRQDGFESDTYRWMLENAPNYGFHNPLWARKDGKKPEWWHFEYIEKDDILMPLGSQSRTPAPVPANEDVYPEEEFSSRLPDQGLPYAQ